MQGRACIFSLAAPGRRAALYISVVACRGNRRCKAIDGICIETERPKKNLIYTAKWAVNAELVVTHRVQYRLLDEDFDAATDDATLWSAWLRSDGEDWPGPWLDRQPAWAKGLAGLVIEPCMQIRALPGSERLAAQREEAKRCKQLTDTLNADGIIIERREIFPMPTVERASLTDPKFSQLLHMRLPQIEAVFRA